MRNQTHSASKINTLLPPFKLIELLDEDLDEGQYEYVHGLSDDVDHEYETQRPYDIEDDAQAAYGRLLNAARL